MFLRVLAGVPALLLVVPAACGEVDGQDAGAASGVDGRQDEMIAESMVLEDGSHGPQLCLGGVMDSLPPQCGGPDLPGWDWKAVSGFDQSHGTRWGVFVVIGTYDRAAGTFTLTRPAVPAEEYDGTGLPEAEDNEPVWHTPCPEPDGGWRVVDPALTSQHNFDQTMRAARARPDFGGLWVDQSINPAATDGNQANGEERLNDPEQMILNVAVTGDPSAAEADLRRTWGGALCVSPAKYTERHLVRIQRQIRSTPDLLSSGIGDGRVEVTVVWDDGSLQAQLDEQYGAGAVVVSSALHPFQP
ncbi:MAG: hypothetical protein GEU93_05200 [Propionibacteriales bacterium]|nr:hypothetical protein [Propionibacteriales bacterium]